jgi:hypothetical protein
MNKGSFKAVTYRKTVIGFIAYENFNEYPYPYSGYRFTKAKRVFHQHFKTEKEAREFVKNENINNNSSN